MSRSFKKHPYAGDNKGTSKKRTAWKTVRQWLKDHPNEVLRGNIHRKIYETWDICDYGDICSWEEYWNSCIRQWYKWKKDYNYPYPDKNEEYKFWLTHYKRK